MVYVMFDVFINVLSLFVSNSFINNFLLFLIAMIPFFMFRYFMRRS